MPRSRERPLLDTTRSISAAAPTRSATRNAPLAGRKTFVELKSPPQRR